MHRSCLLIPVFLLIPAPIYGQSSSTDSQTLQALLAEVRQLHHDLQTTTIAAQRAQILLYRLQGQEAIVARASQRLDDARARLTEVQSNRTKLTADIKKYEELVSQTENSPTDRKQIEDLLPQLKAKLTALENEEQQVLASNQLSTRIKSGCDQVTTESERLTLF